MKSIIFILTALVISLSLTASVQANSDQQHAFSTLLEEIWDYELSVNPTMATRDGVHRYNHLLTDNSPDALAAKNNQWLVFIKQLQEFDLTSLTRDQQISHHMQMYRLQNYVDLYQYNAHWVPITSEYGFHQGFASLASSMPFKTATDYHNYLNRLSQINHSVKQHIMWMRKGIAANYTQPKVVLAGFEESISPFIVNKAEDSVFFTPFTHFPNHFSDAQKQELIQQAHDIILDSVVPAYQTFYDFMSEEYIPKARTDIAAKNWPNGEAFYQNRIRYYTTTDMSAEQIHQLGLKEVARIRQQMQSLVDKLNFNGSIDDFIHFLRTHPQFYASSKRELLAEASFIAKKIDAKLPSMFSYLPRTPYGVAPVPDAIAPKYTTGRYVHPQNDTQPGYYWVNTYALDKRPLYALPALTLHEAVPGHHIQISLAAEMDLPKVRQNTYISAFGEGWGLYAEYLGIEMGIYEDAYADFGRLSYEMWRACRLVIDTGMHMFGWSRQQALDYMLKNTALSEHNVTTEVDRYISWPGQALAYKIGELKIKQLRRKAETALGADFDIREFHKVVLSQGSIPLFILEQNIDNFIAEHMPP
jgi:uncharacterized protein (DUF885 family)